MNSLRPKNLNLFTISFPIPAIVSILHRISGFILFLLIPAVIWLCGFSLTQRGFETIQSYLEMYAIKFIIWLCLIPFCFHFVAGIRHLLSDIHVGDTLPLGRTTGILTFIFAIVLILLAGVWLW